MLAWQGRVHRAHRIAYELLKGPIPVNRELDHLCRVHACVNPEHLEPVTSWTNTLRGVNWIAGVVNTNRCPRGHEFTLENTRVSADGKRRWCRQCRRTSNRQSQRLRRQLASAI
jgi:hypothetical protein